MNETDFALLALTQYYEIYSPDLNGFVGSESVFELGFSATKYTRGDEVVIVYRGSDDPLFDFSESALLFSGIFPPQAIKAAAYYNEAKAELEPGQTLSIAGHSLGGGLGAFVSLLTGAPAHVFNTGNAAPAALHALNVARMQFVIDQALQIADPIFLALDGILDAIGGPELLGLFGGAEPPAELDGSSLSGIHLKGDVLQFIRASSSLELWMPDPADLDLRDYVSPPFVDPFSGAMHAQSLLTIRTALSDVGLLMSPAWQKAAQFFFSALHDDSVAAAAKVDSADFFEADDYSQLQTLLAYSASVIGKNVAGDAAFDAFARDGEQLGLQDRASEDLHNALAKVAVSHAGLLAARKSLIDQNNVPGVLEFDETANSLAFNLTSEKWTIGGVSERSGALDYLIESLDDYISTGLAAYVEEIEVNHSIDAFVFFAEPDGPQNHSLATASNAPFVTEADIVIFVGSAGEDAIVAATSDDIVDGSDGYDSVTYNQLEDSLTISLHHAGLNDYREVDVRADDDQGLGKLFNVEAIYATDFDDTINILPADEYLTPGANPIIARPAIYINGGLGNDTFTIDLAKGSPNAILDGGDGDDVFTITGHGDRGTFANATENAVIPTVLIGGAGSDRFDFSGEVNVFFAYLDDVENAGRLDLGAIAEHISVEGLMPRYSTVVIVNPDASDEIYFNGKLVSGATGNIILSSQYEYEDYTSYIAMDNNSRLPVDWRFTTENYYSTVFSSSNFEYYSENQDILLRTKSEHVETLVTVTDTDGSTLTLYNVVNGMAGFNIAAYSGTAGNERIRDVWENDIWERWFNGNPEEEEGDFDIYNYFSTVRVVDVPLPGGGTEERIYFEDPVLSNWDGPTTTSERWNQQTYNARLNDSNSADWLDQFLVFPSEEEDIPLLQSSALTGAADRIFESGVGNNLFIGQPGSDLYLVTRGSGAVTILSTLLGSDLDVLLLDDVLTSAEFSLSNSGSDLLITVAESSQGAADGVVITVKDHFHGSGDRGITEIHFDNDQILTRAEIDEAVMQDGRLVMSGGSETALFGTAGSDEFLVGQSDNAVFGMGGDDLYRYIREGGALIIAEGQSEGNDTLLVEGVNGLSETSLHARGDHLVIEIFESAPGAGDGGSILILDQLRTDGDWGIELIQDGFGNSWTKQDIIDFLASGQPEEPEINPILGTAGDDQLYGTSASDYLFGDDGDDDLWGYDGDDVLEGGAGDDWLMGGEGSDTFVFKPGSGGDDIADFEVGVDIIEIHAAPGFGFADLLANAEEWGGNAWLYMSVGDIVVLHGVGLSQLSETDFRFIELEPAAPELNQIIGTAGDDVLWGTYQDDYIYGGDGDDGLNGGEGDDLLEGGAGDDWMTGGAGSDTFVFKPGSGWDNIVDFEVGVDLLEIHVAPGFGFVDLLADAEEWGGNAWLYMSVDDIVVLHGVGLSQLSETDFRFVELEPAAPELNQIIGTAGDDLLWGTYQDDYIYGGDGDDGLSGGEGDDVLEGGAGDDWMTGGAGSDTFIFKPGSGGDDIADFEVGVDIIELHGQTANTFSALMANAEEWGGNSWLYFDNDDLVVLHGVELSQLAADDFRFVA